MKNRIERAVLSALTIIIFMTVNAGLSAQTAQSEAPAPDGAKKSEDRPAGNSAPGKRPDHVLENSVSRFGENETGVRVTLRNKLFASDESSLNNMLSIDRREFNDRNAPDNPLYAVSSTLAMQSSEYYAIGRVWSNSDRPFSESSTVGGALVGAKRVYAEGNHSIHAAVYLTNERYFKYRYPFPIPFLSYQYRSDTLILSAGVPSMIMWRITPRFSFMTVYTPVRNIESSFTFRPLPFIALSAEGVWKVDGYFLEDRLDKKDKLYHEYVLARLKAQSYIGRNASVYIAGGYRMIDMFFTSKRSTRRGHVRECPRSLFAEFGASAFM